MKIGILKNNMDPEVFEKAKEKETGMDKVEVLEKIMNETGLDADEVFEIWEVQ